MNLYLLISDLLMAVVVALKFNKLPPQIPLFYSKIPGEDQLVDLWMIALLPVLMHIFIFANNYLRKKYFAEDEFVRKILYYCNIFLIVSFSLIFIRIILLIS